MEKEKQTRPKVYTPEEGETYYFMVFSEAPQTGRAVWRNGSADHFRLMFGNVFESERDLWRFVSGGNK